MRSFVIRGGSAVVCTLVAFGCGSSGTEPGTPGPTGPGPTLGPGTTSTTPVDAGSSGAGGGTSTAKGSGGGDVSGACRAITANGGVALASTPGTTPSVVWGGAAFGIAWQATAPSAPGVRFTLVDRSGAPQGEHVVATAATARLPRAFATGGGWVVVWQEGPPGAIVIRSQRLDANGAPSGGACEVARTNAQDARPVGAASGGAAAATWMTASGSLVGPIGAACAVDSKLVLDGATFPSVNGCGDHLGMTWVHGTNVLFAPLTGAGSSILGAQASLRSATGEAHLPRAACSRTDAFITWEDVRAGAGNEQVYVARASSDGAAQPEVAVPSEVGSANWPDVAFTGTHVAVAYYQFRGGPPAVFLTTLSPTLERTGDDVRLSGSGGAKFPSMAWSGQALAIAWADVDGPVRVAIADCP
jgi:hypothetical protein